MSNADDDKGLGAFLVNAEFFANPFKVLALEYFLYNGQIELEPTLIRDQNI